ncbi:putative MFS transporter [Taphrina deformans PYCC 5710]|uniref:MFS transporter n=1 Tax=Taphrina deformans (strain PYCC 5710 / ATCC 11124 / CBS 356.35 / IMI 108563 / JCM 9778 / NBRC 8474) TaxID=1097556 RepID=R4X911_TAPDE|nr:putative MFS transporter [Taphrina deformans PYCC 5710]|eukprot:CCG81915.1 putative MFS transporter [Taphrina deformans PYCC 5710]
MKEQSEVQEVTCPESISVKSYDPCDPHTFSRAHRWCMTCILSTLAFLSFWAAGAYSPGIDGIRREFGPSIEVANLGVAFYPLGFTLGPLLGAPLSELYGRRIVFLTTIPLTIISCLGIALARNTAMILTFRFLTALFISGPFAVAGGAVSDLWPREDRFLPIILYSTAPNLGSTLGPVVGGFTSFYLTFRWTFYIQMIMLGVTYILIVFFVPETYAPKLRGEVTVDPVEAKKKIKTAMQRPVRLLIHEPIVLFTSIYLAFVYGLLFCSFSAYPVEYQLARHWNVLDSSLAFLGISVGILIAGLLSPAFKPLYMRNPTPEGRLYQACVGAIVLPISLFWWAWTSGANVNAFASISAGGGIGVGLLFLFLSIVDYLVDTYTEFAASALAANGAFRTLVTTLFPLFSHQMFIGLGTQWAMTILAFCSVLLTPIPFVFLKYGKTIRARGKYAHELRSDVP